MDAGVKTTEAGETMEANDDKLEFEDNDKVGINERNVGEMDMEERPEDKGKSDDGIGGSPRNDGYIGETERVESGTDLGERMVEMTDVQRGKVTELEKREGWPTWLGNAVDMLHEGEHRKQMEYILEKLIRIERALGFKAEKMVSIHCSNRSPDDTDYMMENRAIITTG